MSEHQERLAYPDFARLAPGVHAALMMLGQAVDASGLDKTLTELVKLRISQINGCAFCVKFHLDVATRAGVPREKLDLLAAWRDADVFSLRETRALAWAEQLGDLTRPGSADVHARLSEAFTQVEVIMLTSAIAGIHAWNRLGAGLRFAPLPD